MQRVMQNNCAVFRTGEVLDEGVKMMQEAIDKRDNLQVTDDSMIWNSDLVETLELQNLLDQSMATMASAACGLRHHPSFWDMMPCMHVTPCDGQSTQAALAVALIWPSAHT